MTANRRIFLNIIATYGRSLYALAIGLFCGRWTLMALGQVDLGLMGVVGGLTAFIGFFFGILSGAVGRFYAFALGRASVANDPQQGLEECREWFSLAMTIHLIVPLVLLAFGYPAGEWAVRHYLTIPPDRISACVWVWRFTCVSCFLGMVTVPFNAMYGAKQYIAELTIYSFVTSTLNLFFLHYMITHPGVWLAKYALWTCLLGIAPQIIITTRAYFIFPECRFRRKYAWNWSKYKEMLSYTGWNTIGSLGCMLKGQGIAILVNKYFGPSVNAAMGIAGTINGHTQSLSASMQGAFAPAITTALGCGDLEGARRFAFRFCKFGMMLSLIFMIPLSLELPVVVRLWLKNPPEYVIGLCWLMMAFSFMDNNTLGHSAIIMANGKIKWYQIILGSFNLMALPFAWIFCALGFNVYFVNVGVMIAWAFLVYGRLFFARYLLGMSIRYWGVHVMLPILCAMMATFLIGFIVPLILEPGFIRVVLTTIVCETVFIPTAWFLILDESEKEYVGGFLKSKFSMFRKVKI